MKKVLSVILSLCVLMSALCFTASAQTTRDIVDNGLIYQIVDEKEAYLTGVSDTSRSEYAVPDVVQLQAETEDVPGTPSVPGDNDDNDVPDPFSYVPVVGIDYSAFSDCDSAIGVTIGKNVKDIDITALNVMPNLKSITVSESNNYYKSVGGVLYNYGLTELIYCPSSIDYSPEIPATVTVIGTGAFESSSLTEISVPQSVTVISEKAFWLSQIKSIYLPSAVTVGKDAFLLCSNLQTVYFGNSLKSVGSDAFLGCVSLISVIFDGATGYEIGTNAFLNCPNLVTVTLADDAVIGERAFSYYYENGSTKLQQVENFIICSGENSNAQKYAQANGLSDNFIVMTDKGYWIVDTEHSVTATCSQQGKIVLVYSLDKTLVKEILLPLTLHKTSGWITVAEPTCDKDGYRHIICTVCGTETQREVLPKLGHEPKYDSTISATCTKNGYQIYRCIRCGAETSRDVLKALGHQYKMQRVAVSSKKMGYTKYTCTVCGAVKTDSYKFITMSGFYTTRSGKNLTVKFNKVSGATGYDIYLSANKKHYYTTKNAYTIKGLKTSKSYSVKVRPYRTVSGKRVYGPYTAYATASKATSIKKVSSPKSKSIKCTWKKISGVTGYQIQIATDSKFKKGVKTYTVKSSKTVSKTIKKLKGKKKYYVRVRTYKKTGAVTGYSAWSGKKSVKTKR